MDHIIVVDLGFGDSGKGTVVDWLCSRGPASASGGASAGASAGASVRAVVRFNGGAQAGHNVVTPEGRHHTFAQFGSGTLWGVPTFLSRFMMVDPLALAAEAAHLRAVGVMDPFGLLTVDADALLTTPYHRAANRARERARGADRHGSCGMGVGETAAYAIAHQAAHEAPRVGDCANPKRLARLLKLLRDRVADEFGAAGLPRVGDCVDAFLAFGARVEIGEMPSGGPLVFEGAQGVLLDESFGFHPYTTWSTTTFANALELEPDAYRLGVLRTYTTRHGPGPMVTEDPALAVPEPHNDEAEWQGAFRLGHLDLVALRYAVEVAGGVDGLALTHLDAPAVHPELRVCRSYQVSAQVSAQGPARLSPGDQAHQAALGRELMTVRPVLEPAPAPGSWPEFVAGELVAPVVVTSHGPTWLDKTPAVGGNLHPLVDSWRASTYTA